jgi:tagatose 6-phosphate kinase
VKPNQEELAGALGRPLDTPAEQWRALEQLAGWGVAVGVLSLGAAGARVLWEGRRYHITPAPVTEVNALGCGDSMVAGLAWAAAQGCGPEDALRWGAACGAANAAVWDPGGFDRADAEALRQHVGIHLLEDDREA